MKRRAAKASARPAEVRVYFTRRHDEISKADVTCQAFVQRLADGTDLVTGQVSVGPGAGPHMSPSSRFWRNVSWDVMHLADFIDRERLDEPAEPDPQRSIDDHLADVGAPLTLRVGGIR